ncbi:RDD family protein [Lentibacillus sp. CBA3610]|uniref:RDD family protein n=1 Tax=Lentibacillus sp. CBA3610 TaxID=2518176 RepID=UPI001595BCEF|nr:RDD family protein [Lentibacillus sp. CBA3610]QKY69266.1 RDD family protein [Lentibacillus sp. CBA3610]
MNQEKVAVKTPEYVSLDFKLAGLGSRAGAMIIDQLLLTIFNIVTILVLVFVIQSDLTAFLGNSTLPLAIAIILIFIVYWGYFFVCEYFFGGKTIGKNILGIRVMQDNGHSLTLLSSLIRNLLRIIDMLPTGYFIGIIWVFFHSKHKRLGDIVAGTIVVHERKGKKTKKSRSIEKEIESRGLTKESLALHDGALRLFGMKEWKLLKGYSERLLQLQEVDRIQLTKKLATALLPKIDLEPEEMNYQKTENTLLVLYLILKDEWEFEL